MQEEKPSILITSVGAKVGLLKAFRETTERFGGRIVGIDIDPYAPAGKFCHSFHTLPDTESETFMVEIEFLFQKEKIDFVIPTREQELILWTSERWGKDRDLPPVALSGQTCLRICLNKLNTHRWLNQNGFRSPASVLLSEAREHESVPELPFVAKDPEGSGSRGIRFVTSRHELDLVPDHWMAQSLLSGKEYTLNAYVDRKGRCRCLIPHERIEVVVGEVNRAMTIRDEGLIETGRRIAEALPSAFGPLNIQVFRADPLLNPWVIDINPRFGGGYPLAHAAGGRFTDWLVTEMGGAEPSFTGEDWEDGLIMTRYRDSLFESTSGFPGPTRFIENGDSRPANRHRNRVVY